MCYTLEWQTRGGAVLERSAIELAAGVAEIRPYCSYISRACSGEYPEAIKHLADLDIGYSTRINVQNHRALGYLLPLLPAQLLMLITNNNRICSNYFSLNSLFSQRIHWAVSMGGIIAS